ncbi:MAG: aspartate aminotransferase [Candidatus Rokuibacteriota bacterium]|nr:MAG: aspartate aminotransferase [Candidatus Rokubacteria bacterium]
MISDRMQGIAGFGIDRVAAAVEGNPDVLRLENLDTDLPPPAGVLEATRAATGTREGNSWLPFTGKIPLRQAVARQIARRSGWRVDGDTGVTITCGEGDAMVDALFVATDPGDEVILTDPTYAGMLNRVRIVGAVPRPVPLVVREGEWRLDVAALEAAVGPRTRAMFMVSPNLPAGHVLNREEWEAVARLCVRHDLWLINNAWMEAILFDGHPYIQPATLPGMAERVLHVGSVSFEQRMIGWRIGWIAAPPDAAAHAARAHIYNALTPGGIAQAGALAALVTEDADLPEVVADWQRRRDLTLDQLAGLPAVKPAGGWSLVMDAAALGWQPADLSLALARHGVAATPMDAWGADVARRLIRFIYTREPLDRLACLRGRLDAAMRE